MEKQRGHPWASVEGPEPHPLGQETSLSGLRPSAHCLSSSFLKIQLLACPATPEPALRPPFHLSLLWLPALPPFLSFSPVLSPAHCFHVTGSSFLFSHSLRSTSSSASQNLPQVPSPPASASHFPTPFLPLSLLTLAQSD